MKTRPVSDAKDRWDVDTCLKLFVEVGNLVADKFLSVLQEFIFDDTKSCFEITEISNTKAVKTSKNFTIFWIELAAQNGIFDAHTDHRFNTKSLFNS
jgi:hypothetical protein